MGMEWGVTFQTLIRKVPCSNTCRDIWNLVEFFRCLCEFLQTNVRIVARLYHGLIVFQFKKLPIVRHYSYIVYVLTAP
jgi:hypothetical protein